VTFKIVNRLKFNNDNAKLNDDFKCHIMIGMTLKGPYSSLYHYSIKHAKRKILNILAGPTTTFVRLTFVDYEPTIGEELFLACFNRI
jgi:hypothetical protein